MTLKQRVLSMMVALLLLSLLSGCRSSKEPVTITLSTGATSEAGNQVFLDHAEAFMAQHPDIRVEVVFLAESTDEQRRFYVEQFQERSPDIDIISVDIIWPPEFGDQGWTLPLNDYIEEQGIDLDAFLPGPVQGNTWQGELVSMPQFVDAGMLYYRQDLLDKYGFGPPETWAELVQIADAIVEGERAASPEMVGFVYQADQYEGLVCNYLEYVWSNGADVLNESGDAVVLDTSEAAEALEIFSAMQAIAPEGILTFKEADALNYFQAGNAVFMRNWPYAWFESNKDGSPVQGKVGFAALPRGPRGTTGASTLGGWQLGINTYTEHPDEAFAFLAFITNEERQNYGAIHAAQNPTRRASYQDPEVLAANPYMRELSDVFVNALPRPVHPRYADAISPIIQAEVYAALLGEKDAATATADMAARIQSVIDE